MTTSTELKDVDLEMAARLERLAARRNATPDSTTTTPSNGPKAPRRATTKKRHAARKSRVAALGLSLVTTSGLTGFFFATDTPSAPVALDSGVTKSPSAVVTDVANSPAAITEVTGDVFRNQFGDVQVQATFGGDGSIVDVTVLQAPNSDGKSVQINNRAVPILNQEALTAQSANVDTVSGATYTTRDYEASLQSAIDLARANGVTQL